LLLGALLDRLTGWRVTPGALALLLSAWLLPTPLAGLLWRPFFIDLNWTTAAHTARLAIGAVLLWRLTPLAVLLLGAVAGRRRWAIAGAALLYSLLVDAGTALLLTGGEPFNASHTWASWLLLQLWVNRAWAECAVMAGGLAVVAGLVVASGLVHSDNNPAGLGKLAQTVNAIQRPTFSWTVAAWIVAALWSLTPWLFWVPPLVEDGVAALGRLVAAGGLRWIVNWGLALELAAVVAAVLAAGLRGWSSTVRRGAAILSVALLPLCPVALAYLRPMPGRLSGWWVTAVVIGCLVAGPLAWLPAAPSHLRRLHRAAARAGIGLAHSFGVELVLDAPRAVSLPAPGLTRYLGDVAVDPAALAVGLLMAGLLALATAWLVAT
jgi:hypothetical protein